MKTDKYPGGKIVAIDQRLSDEDRQFFRQMYEQHHRALCKFLARFGLDKSRVEDIAQDVYLRVVRQNEPHKLREKPRAYLYRVAVNLYRDMMRRDMRQQAEWHTEFDEESMSINLLTPEIHASAQERLDIVKQAIRDLPPHSRQIVLLYRFRNLSCEEISRDLNIPLRSVQRYLNEAMLFCQARLGGAE